MKACKGRTPGNIYDEELFRNSVGKLSILCVDWGIPVTPLS